MDSIKHFIDYLSAPTISFTLLTIILPFLFPPTDWFDKKSRQLGLNKIWTNKGAIVVISLITIFFIAGFYDPNFNIILMKPDNFPIVLMVYGMFFYIWWG